MKSISSAKGRDELEGTPKRIPGIHVGVVV